MSDQKWLQTAEIMDSAMRPYTQTLTENEKSYATIVILQEGAQKEYKGNAIPLDYLSGDFSSYISLLSVDPDARNSIEAKTLREGGSIVIDSLDGINPYYGIFNNFSLQSVSEQNSQIVKIHQNFSGYWNAFFFGEQPRLFTFSGVFLDSKEYPYYQEFMVAYDKWLAGRKCVENRMTMKIIYDGRLIDGYILSVNTVNTAENPFLKQFQFQVLVRASSWIRSNIIAKSIANSYNFSYSEVTNGLSNPNRLRYNSLGSAIGKSVIDIQQQAELGAKIPGVP